MRVGPCRRDIPIELEGGEGHGSKWRYEAARCGKAKGLGATNVDGGDNNGLRPADIRHVGKRVFFNSLFFCSSLKFFKVAPEG